MDADPRNAVIVKSTIELARNLGLRTVAEGIEDATCWTACLSSVAISRRATTSAAAVPEPELLRWCEASTPVPLEDADASAPGRSVTRVERREGRLMLLVVLAMRVRRQRATGGRAAAQAGRARGLRAIWAVIVSAAIQVLITSALPGGGPRPVREPARASYVLVGGFCSPTGG